jgi:hypothetical protein
VALEASVVTSNGGEKFRSVRVTNKTIFDLSSLKACSVVLDHLNVGCFRTSVSGAAIWA